MHGAQPAEATRRLLVINPNSNPAVTAQIRRVADQALGPGILADVVSPGDSPRSIETPADRETAEARVLALIERTLDAGYDGYVLACFDDIAIAGAHRLTSVPIIGAVDASLALARTFAQRFAVVTTVDAAVPGIRRLLRLHGAAALCSVHAAGVGVAAASQFDRATRARLAATIDAAVADGAEAIILGSGGLAGHAPELARGRSVRLIDSIAAAVVLAAAVMTLSTTKVSGAHET